MVPPSLQDGLYLHESLMFAHHDTVKRSSELRSVQAESHLVDLRARLWHSIDKISSSYPFSRLAAPWRRVKSAGPSFRATFNHLLKLVTTCAVSSTPPSLLIDCGTPNVSITSTNFRLTSLDPLEARGYSKRKMLALSTTTSKYWLPAADTWY